MRASNRRWLMTVGAACFLVGPVQAQTTTDRPGSILLFPKVVSNESQDTTIQISNTGNSLNTIHCTYLRARSTGTACDAVDFDVTLTKAQPTFWSVGQGRRVDSTDFYTGFDPGLIPPMSEFTGSLICVEVEPDGSRAPLGQNKLTGQASVGPPLTGSTSSDDAASYNAVAIPALAASVTSPLGLDDVEYARCPSALWTSFVAVGAQDPGNFDEAGASLTLMPCSLDLRNGVRNSGTVSYIVRDEFESPYSGTLPVGCSTTVDLGELQQFRSVGTPQGVLPTTFANVRFAPNGGPLVGVFGSSFGEAPGAALVNLHTEPGTTSAAIRLP